MSLNSREFRDALGHFATGVAVISTFTEDGNTLGLTVNSFASVSLDPPLILWSLDKGSDRFAPLMQVERFAVNILGQGEQEISRRLSRKGQSTLQPDEFQKSTHGVPVLNHAAAIFECVVHDKIEAGDHVIFIGRVLASSHNSHETPLLYYRGAYRALGPKS